MPPPLNPLNNSAPATPITYPARPINGGPLDKAAPKTGEWVYEPKYNGWRTLIHVPTGTMFNRHGAALSIAAEFHHALAWLRTKSIFDWLDCEALERRHTLGQGSLIILDAPSYPGFGDWAGQPYRNRHATLRNYFHDGYDVDFLDEPERIEPDTVFLTPHVAAPDDGRELYAELRAANERLGVPFYEGLVAKRADSRYPIQRRSPDETFPFWVKHRWAF